MGVGVVGMGEGCEYRRPRLVAATPNIRAGRTQTTRCLPQALSPSAYARPPAPSGTGAPVRRRRPASPPRVVVLPMARGVGALVTTSHAADSPASGLRGRRGRRAPMPRNVLCHAAYSIVTGFSIKFLKLASHLVAWWSSTTRASLDSVNVAIWSMV